MAYGDLGIGDWNEGDRSTCQSCGASVSISTLQCYSCRQVKERPIRPEDVGFYVSGWIWDPEEPDLRHRSLHSFGPFETEVQALRVMENLSGPTDDSDLKPELWSIKASDVVPEKPAPKPRVDRFYDMKAALKGPRLKKTWIRGEEF